MAAGRPTAPGSDRVALAAFVVGSILAGGNAVAIRFSNRELDPLWGAGFRFALASALLLAVAALLRRALPRGRALTGAVLFGLFNFAGGFALAYYALLELHAGLGQTILAIVPLVTLLLAALQGQERLGTRNLAGAVLALTGIAVVSQAPLRQEVPVASVLAALGSAVCLAQAAVVVRRFPPVHPVTMNAVAMGVGAALLVSWSALAGEAIALPERAETWAAVAFLAVVGSVVVFGLYIVVLARWSASRAAYTFVVVPVVTVVLSAWLDDEPVGLGLVAGGVLVLGGVYLGALRTTSGRASSRAVVE